MSKARSRARRLATQALYQWQLAGQNVIDIEAQFVTQYQMSKESLVYFRELIHGVPGNLTQLDSYIKPLLDRPIEEVDPVERAILRLGTYELEYRPDVPYRVIINESVELAKTFGAEQGHTYVNSILDGVARKLRAPEVNAVKKKELKS
jgi:N utilization substance protein B